MSTIQQIRKTINRMPKGELFTAKNFRHLGSADNIKQILSRLVKEGLIERTTRGVYLKPKIIKNIGTVLPPAREIAKTLTESTGETIVVHGAEAARQLNLTTQVPMRHIFYTNGESRILKIRNQTIELKHVNPSRLIAPDTMAGMAILALIYLGKNHVTDGVIEKIKMQLSSHDFDNIYKEIKNMPAWLASAFYHYKKEKNNG